MDFLNRAAGTVTGGIGGGASFLTNTIGKGVGKIAEKAADTAADAALAPLNLIETSISSVSNLGPDIVANRRAKINTMLSDIQSAATRYNAETSAKRMREVRATITARVKEVNDDSTVPQDIKDKYAIILDNSGASPEDLLDNLANADDDLLVHENKEFSAWRLIKRSWRLTSDYVYYIILLVTMIFGGVILSNVYINEKYLPIRLYYFFYGIIFFPASLAYGIINPPVWSATLFPLFQIAGPQPFVQGPKVGGAVPTDIAQGTGIVAQRSSVFQSKKDVRKDIEEAVRMGMTREEAVQKEITQLEEKGVTTEAAVREISSIVQPSGPSVSGAVTFIKPPTFEQRITAVLSSLFGYKAIGGSTFGMRVVSIVLSAATLGMAYSRGDINSIYSRVTEIYNLGQVR